MPKRGLTLNTTALVNEAWLRFAGINLELSDRERVAAFDDDLVRRRPDQCRHSERLFRLCGQHRFGRRFAVGDGSRFLVRGPYRPPPDPILVWNPAAN